MIYISNNWKDLSTKDIIEYSLLSLNIVLTITCLVAVIFVYKRLYKLLNESICDVKRTEKSASYPHKNTNKHLIDEMNQRALKRQSYLEMQSYKF